MHTVRVIAGGFGLLALCLLLARVAGGAAASAYVAGARWFIPLWFVAAAINLWIGVSRAGYTFAQEAPVFALVFGLPACVAAVIWWHFAGG
jgi:hypothetical protein